MSSDVAVRVRGLGKAYKIAHHERQVTLAEQVIDRLKHPRGRKSFETFWALRDIEFDVYPGEVLGLVGRNGAGKSTLLKVLSRITAPTEGRVEVNGRLGSLLEVGTGFHPELTGRENIFLNGAILGMRRHEIVREFDAIVDFAGVARFLDTPVKRYSSGMYVRLAFAVAAHLRTEVLLVDEVLAVGDAEFQRKCLGEMQNVASQGRTVLFVSHNMSAVSTLCTRAVLLEGGRVVDNGETRGIVSRYLSTGPSDAGWLNDLSQLPRHSCAQTGDVRLVELRFTEGSDFATIESGLRTSIVLDVSVPRECALLMVLHDENEQPFATLLGDRLELPSAGRHQVSFSVDSLPVRPGRYAVDLVVTSSNPLNGYVDHDVVPKAVSLEVVSAEGTESSGAPRSWGNVRVAAYACPQGLVPIQPDGAVVR